MFFDVGADGDAGGRGGHGWGGCRLLDADKGGVGELGDVWVLSWGAAAEG